MRSEGSRSRSGVPRAALSAVPRTRNGREAAGEEEEAEAAPMAAADVAAAARRVIVLRAR